MKLGFFGGGGVRTPLFVRSLLSRMRSGGRQIDELFLSDINEKRLALMGSIAQWLVRESGMKLKVSFSCDPAEAAAGANAAVLAIRPGLEKARVLDEKVAMKLGLIGQETVGAGGFAMACRSIPEVFRIAEILDARGDDCVIINFTNPSGIVTQALRDAGYGKAYGICDSADAPHRNAADYFKASLKRIEILVFGLNHLSAAYSLKKDGEEILSSLLADEKFLETYLGLYDKETVKRLGVLPNEYLYYYIHPDRALESMRRETKTRGEFVEEASAAFFAKADPQNPEEALRIHAEVIGKRNVTYMKYAWEERERPHHAPADEGYAGVALDLLWGLSSANPIKMVLSVPTTGAPSLLPGDVAEITCKVSSKGAVPIIPSKGSIPEGLARLVEKVKLFERLTCSAVSKRSRKDAVEALSINPLIGPRSAEKLLDAYASAHGGILAEIAR